MKILERGGPDISKWRTQVLCRGCLSKLEVDHIDLKNNRCTGEEWTPSGWWWSVTCPLCSHVIPIDVPVTIDAELRRRQARR